MDKRTETFIHTVHHIWVPAEEKKMLFFYSPAHQACLLIIVRSFAIKVLGLHIFLNKLTYYPYR